MINDEDEYESNDKYWHFTNDIWWHFWKTNVMMNGMISDIWINTNMTWNEYWHNHEGMKKIENNNDMWMKWQKMNFMKYDILWHMTLYDIWH